MTIWRMRVSCSITKATNTHGKHVIFIVFARQRWLSERASVLRNVYIVYIIITETVCLLLGTNCVFY
jgi:hypothetical protein